MAPVRPVRHLHRARHAIGAGRARHPAIAAEPTAHGQAFAESSLGMRTMPVYVMRPTSCDSLPSTAIQSLPPAGFKPATQKLLDELAGPASRVAEGPEAVAPSAAAGGLVPGGQTPTSPPDLLPPSVVLTEGPPVIAGPGGPPSVAPPQGGQPPTVVVSPPLPPTELPPGSSPPTTPAPPIIAAIPEPATWAMMIVGCLAVGGTLRSRRASARRTERQHQATS